MQQFHNPSEQIFPGIWGRLVSTSLSILRLDQHRLRGWRSRAFGACIMHYHGPTKLSASLDWICCIAKLKMPYHTIPYHTIPLLRSGIENATRQSATCSGLASRGTDGISPAVINHSCQKVPMHMMILCIVLQNKWFWGFTIIFQPYHTIPYHIKRYWEKLTFVLL